MPESLAKLEKDCEGRLGVAVLDIGSGESSGYRVDERFAMCSTFKMLLAAAVLQRVDTGKENLDRMVQMPTTGFLFNSPMTQPHAGGKMAVSDLCVAILTRSDNTGANLLLETIGGPAGITQFARSLGDNVTRLDRVETALNEALPGDPRDTTSPAAMAANWRKVLLGDKLLTASRKQLTDWLIANKTGDERLRAGSPTGWTVGDKTGSNGENTTNDVAILWPTAQAPVIVAAYLTSCAGPESKRDAVLAEVGRQVAKCIQPAQ
ncbi:class A beta-lactamase [Acidobacterium sp. S8]|uniref:class A beta-lactamase n=1 Tax=Acidobacterium sp. S8 TaxID=1641854 RepID=UPI0020B12686|nr:class A beta-lactamase [Acidobacterium sp. S8]